MAARVAAAVRRQRRRGAHLRNRLVPDAGAVRRLLSGVGGRAAGHVHGRDVPRQPFSAAHDFAQPAPAARVCPAGARHRCHRPHHAHRHAAGRPGVYQLGWLRRQRLPAARDCGQHLSAAAHAVDGRNVAGGGSMDRNHPPRRSVAGMDHCWPVSTCCACST